MGPHLSTPITTKASFSGKMDPNAQSIQLIWSASQMQGWRIQMEDAHIVYPVDTQSDQIKVFGIFDGHGGMEVAQFVKNHFIQELLKNNSFKAKDYKQALIDNFHRMDEILKTPEAKKELADIKVQFSQNQDPLQSEDDDATPRAENDQVVNQEPSEQLQEEQICKAGCTANVILIDGNKLVCANAGDTRTIICKKNQICFSSFDHKPDRPLELERIQKAGGFVSDARINGSINISRAIGDLEYKKNETLGRDQQLITAQPDITEVQLDQDTQWIFMGCDGIYDQKSNEDYLKLISAELGKIPNVNKDFDAKELTPILAKILDTNIAPNPGNVGCDNMTAILIKVNHK